VDNAQRVLDRQLHLPAGYTLKWSGEYEFQLRARARLKVILPIVFGLIFVLLYTLFQSVTEAIVLILPTGVRDDRRAIASVHDGFQLQRRRMGRVHRVVRNSGRDRRRHGDLSSRSSESSHRRWRRSLTRKSSWRSSKVQSSGFDPS
jgi:hypothetical protein